MGLLWYFIALLIGLSIGLNLKKKIERNALAFKIYRKMLRYKELYEIEKNTNKKLKEL
jgi:hypothetical protein